MSVNLVVLSGRVGIDPEVRKFESGQVASFSLATTERGYKLANGTEIPEQTEWHNIAVKSNLAAFVEKHVKKGALLTVVGKIQYKEYEDKQGNKKKATNIICEKLDLLSWDKTDTGGSAAQTEDDPF